MLTRGEGDRYYQAMRVMRDRSERYGPVVVPRRRLCPACGVFKNPQEMHRLPYTGAVRDAMDMVCASCARVYAKELAKVWRLVCVGCREVVDMREPVKERDGFVWAPGKCYHTPSCPECSGDPDLKSSPVVEKILFYKTNGLPYE